MAIEEVNQELWALAQENVTKQQEEAFDALFDEAREPDFERRVRILQRRALFKLRGADHQPHRRAARKPVR